MSRHSKKGTSLVRRLPEQAGAAPHAVAHHRRGIALRFARFRAAGVGGFAALLAVLWPGLLAGLSDDDPAGITTYSVLGADNGDQMLWIIPDSTVLLVKFHLMAVRVGAASGKGFVGAVRARWGHRCGYFAVIGLLLANFGTICAKYAGISAACSLVGISTCRHMLRPGRGTLQRPAQGPGVRGHCRFDPCQTRQRTSAYPASEAHPAGGLPK